MGWGGGEFGKVGLKAMLNSSRWTTWTVGAVDPRAIAIIPIVMDELNFLENLKHHYRSLAGWTFAFKAYWDVVIPLYLQDPKLQVAKTGSLNIN